MGFKIYLRQREQTDYLTKLDINLCGPINRLWEQLRQTIAITFDNALISTTKAKLE